MAHTNIQLSRFGDIFARYETDEEQGGYAEDKGKGLIPTKYRPRSRMGRWAVGRSNLRAFMAPIQDMANGCHKEFAAASKKNPPCAPFVAPTIRDKPWISPLQSSDLGNIYRLEIRARKTKESPQKFSYGGWVLYTIRLISTAGLCAAWGHPGESQNSQTALV